MKDDMGYFSVTWNDTQLFRIQLHVGQYSSVGQLKVAVRDAFCSADFPTQDFTLTDGSNDIVTDEAVSGIQSGDTVMVLSHTKGALGKLLAKETVSFSPHPKTLTMAGDYEYFAAQGHHPFAFALAELIDNALRATKGNADSRPRSIAISLVISDKGDSGLVSVRDNGCGMSKKELNEWAVMNLSMEDRGLLPPTDASTSPQAPAGCTRYLTGDLSYFGVGSKNAAFFIGQSVKLATQQAGSQYVHELCITAAELESRYKSGGAVYEGDMVHRQPGDDATLTAAEGQFACTREWVADEVSPTSAASPSGTSFTRLIIAELKGDALQQLQDSDGSARVMRDLAHLYHYYLHGVRGNCKVSHTVTTAADGSGQVVGQQQAPPTIVVEFVQGSRTTWRRNLADVDDDMETRYLTAARSQLEFSVDVPSRGVVEGVLWYFPYALGQETVPHNDDLQAYRQAQGHQGGDEATQLTTQRGTQQPLQTQRTGASRMAGGRAAVPEPDVPSQLQRAMADMEDSEPGSAPASSTPLFETFWQGRLIPGGAVQGLPFIDAVRNKRNTALGRDELPDEVFARIRGALFFGPAFKVTRNKLTFRDNLSQLLSTAVPTDRLLEKRFKEWLAGCHQRLDRTVRFTGIADERLRAVARRDLGEGFTAFTSICDGSRTLRVGDAVQLATKPRQVGIVRYFSIKQVVQTEGSYARGFLTYSLVPAAVHGSASCTVALRRVEGMPLSEEQVEQYTRDELRKLPCTVRVEPHTYGSPQALELCVGDVVPDTAVHVINGHGQRLKALLVAGHKAGLRVAQQLRYLGPGRLSAPDDAPASTLAALDPNIGDGKGSSHQQRGGPVRKRRRSKAEARGGAKEQVPPEQRAGSPSAKVSPGAAAAGSDPEAAPTKAAPLVMHGEEVFAVENKTPVGDQFQFSKIVRGLDRAGTYHLVYVVVAPATLPTLSNTVFCRTVIHVSAGAACRFELQGEGRAVACAKAIQLGEILPPIRVALFDAYNNEITAPPPEAADAGWLTVSLSRAAAACAPGLSVDDVDVQWDMVVAGSAPAGGASTAAAGVSIHNLQVLGSEDCATSASGMALFRPAPSSSLPLSDQMALPQQQAAITTAAADLSLVVAMRDLGQQTLCVQLVPGAPHALRLLPGHPFDAAGPVSEEGTCGQPSMAELPTVGLVNGDSLPDFKVVAVDRWGNMTRPTSGVAYDIQLECAVLQPPVRLLDVDTDGVAYAHGLTAAGDSASIGHTQELTLQIKLRDGVDAIAFGVASSHLLQDLRCGVVLQPCTRPATMLILKDGEALELSGESGGGDVTYVLPAVPVGSTLKGLSCQFLDEAGRVSPAVKGKLQVSWAKSQRKVVADERGECGPLPALRVDQCVQEGPQMAWLRFKGEGQLSGLNLEITLEIRLAAGAPHHWCVARGDAGGEGATEEQAQHFTCGVPFHLEVEAQDAYGNRCSASEGCSLPVPTVMPHSEEGQLVYNPAEWTCGWGQAQAGGGDVYGVTMTLAGRAGAIKLSVESETTGDGQTAMIADELHADLSAGPPKALCLGPALGEQWSGPVSVGPRGRLGCVVVRLVDQWDNTVPKDKAEVVLKTDAYAADESGNGIRVKATSSNRMKLKDGVACFRDVCVDAGQAPPGVYTCMVELGSRKVDVVPASFAIQVCVHNLVTGLCISGADVPDAHGPSLVVDAGGSLCLVVAVDTQDAQPLPWEAAVAGLRLHLEPPGGSRADILSLSPTAALPPAAAASPSFQFTSSELTMAGQYTATAEYVEHRPELLTLTGDSSGGSSSSSVRSSSTMAVVQAGPAVTASLAGRGGEVQAVAATNAPDASDRLLIAAAAVQLRDQFGNAAAQAGVLVRWSLAITEAADALLAGPGCALPVLQAAEEGALDKPTDDRGRAFFGDLCIREGSGRLSGASSGGAPAEASPVLPLELQLHWWQPTAAAGGTGIGAAPGSLPGSWVFAWSCSVSFSDDDVRCRRLKDLLQQRDQWAAQRHAVQDRRLAATREVEGASQDAEQAAAAVARARSAVDECGGGVVCAGLDSVAAAEAHLKMLCSRRDGQSQEARPQVAARFGVPRQQLTVSLQRCLALVDQGVVGVMAQLGTVDDPRLAALLSYNFSSTLTNLVVSSSAAGQRLRDLLVKDNFHVPSYAPLDLLQVFVPEAAAVQSSMQGLSELASRLLADACEGCDPPLPLMLPHTRALLRAATRGGDHLPAQQYPAGFIGHAVNLIRPVVAGHRAKLLSALIGPTLVFETLEQGTGYRQYVTQVLRGTVNDIITLDGGRIAGKGVVSGSGFKVPKLEELQIRFGIASRQQGASRSAHELIAALELLVQALRNQEVTAQALETARQAADEAVAQVDRELATLAQDMQAADRAIAGLQANSTGYVRNALKRAHPAAAEGASTDAVDEEALPPAQRQEHGNASRKQRGRRRAG